MRSATFDSSFWVHAVYLGLVDQLLADFTLICAPDVEREFKNENATSTRLRELLVSGGIRRIEPKVDSVKLPGRGERAAINLAIERSLTLLIDDWRPFETARQNGVEVINIAVYVVKLAGERRITTEEALTKLARMIRRGTLRLEWIMTAMKMVAEVQERTDRNTQ